MRKILRTLFVLTLLFLSFQSKAQITIGTVDAGPYGIGSNITVPIRFTDNQSEFRIGNTFTLYISDVNGNFVGNGTQIGTYAGFYTAFINGTIPNLPTSSNYKLQIRSTNPARTIDVPGTLDIRNVNSSAVALTPNLSSTNLGGDNFGWCPASAANNRDISLTSNAVAPTIVKVKLTNLITGATVDYDEIPGLGFDITGINLGYYSLTATATTLIAGVSIKSIKTYFLHNTTLTINIQDIGRSIGCLSASGPGAPVEYQITLPDGISNNYPGTTYIVNWGDNISDNLTIKQIADNASKITHNYTIVSCGQPTIPGPPAILNSFKATITATNPVCAVSSSTTAYAQVFQNPTAKITPENSIGCINTLIRFNNTSTGGTRSNCSTEMDYTWYVDGVKKRETTSNAPFDWTFTTKGEHTVRLVASNGVGTCTPSEFTARICIQEKPQPIFGFDNQETTGCAPLVVQAVDKSIVDAGCGASSNTYNWVVNSPTGVVYDNSLKEPIFTFNNPGRYTVVLQISNACGIQTSPAQQIVIVNGTPTIALAATANLCRLGTYKYNDVTADLTNIKYTGTFEDLADTYTWTVTGSNGEPLGIDDYEFAEGTDFHSKYPSITFKNYTAYKVTIAHKNSCGTTTKSQIITFYRSPEPTIVADRNPICYNTVASLVGDITNRTPTTTFRWEGQGQFSNPTNLTTNYTPSAAELNNLTATVRLVVNTGLTGVCATVFKDIIITINPNNTTTNPIETRSQSICTGGTTSFTPTSSVQGSTFSWTAVNTVGTATGFTSTGSGSINETIFNTSPTANATVVYTITPLGNTCDGVPFTFTVTITPKPVITTPELEKTICSNSLTAIAVSSNIQTAFTWVATPSAGITGSVSNPIKGTPTTELLINNTLINNTVTQGTVTYSITPYSSTGCEGATISVTVKVDPTLTPAYAGPTENICATDNYTLNATPVLVGTGRWSVVSPQTVTFDNEASPTAIVSGLVAGQTYTFRWTVTGTGSCPGSFSDVEITVNTPTNPGTTTGSALVCEAANNGFITLSGITGNVKGWESSTDGGTTWQVAANTNTTTSYNYINIIVPTQFRAIVQNGGCPSLPSTATTITIAPATTIANAGTPQTLCAQRDVALKGNAFATGEIGLWEKVSGPGNIVIASPNAAETNVTGLVDGADYVFRWTITGNSPCGPTTSTVNIRNNAPILQSIIGNGNIVCFGQTVTLDGTTPTGGEEGVYSYTWESKTGAGAWTIVSGAISEDLTVTLTTAGTISYRRTVTSGGCNSISNEYLITVQEPITNNTINANQDICSGDPIAALTGSTPAGSNGVFRYQWQSRLATETAWTNIAGALSQNFSPSTLPASTILFRRIVTTDQCDGALQSISNEVTITVRQNAIAEFTFTAEKGCAPFALNITATNDPARNATYTWFADNVQIGTGVTFPGYTITESNKSVEIKLVVTSAQNCRSAEFKYNFSTNQAVPATFTQDKTEGCGPLSVTFVNTSVLSAGATFTWDFGNGKTSTQTNPAPVTFDPEPTGRDTTYIVTLTSFTSCGSNSVTSTVFVKAKPVAVFSPSKTDGCSPMLVNFTNTSPGSTNRYFYDFGDGTPILEKTDKSPVSHTYNTTTTQTFRATLTVVNECGTDVRGYNIRVAPQNITPELVVDANEKEGCAPLLVNFDNNSIGATRFTFDFGDGGTANTVSPGTVQHTFTRPGTYTVTMTAYNSCSEIATTETITVLPQPAADFNADITLGCAGLAVQFRNTTQDGFSYRWDFGDGTTSDEFEPIHTYDGEQEYYTVTLTATNTLGCSIAVIKNQYIHIVLPPVARFNVNPSTVISIPNYTFRFEDESTNTPTIWAWDFGDGTTSSLQNPSHTYADTGSYVVRLRVSNQQGCSTSTFKTVQIVGVPGYLFVPNSFMPGGENPELREFKAKGSGIKTWKMSVFNKWGQTLWETTELNEGRPAKGWDGTFQGIVQPQGVFFWKIDIEFINGTEWKGMTYDSSAPKKTGVIHLIR